ncbi:hypothetical protein [Paraferrimonas sp. SM1919]|uniref:hypothetical protein n=1 Tax=Paraferrimonas sp. SM1919 TaxID=2662263 RepID=UPI0013D459DE|nr:hypothetical protein [Paraferrimonas sp. SM1919]
MKTFNFIAAVALILFTTSVMATPQKTIDAVFDDKIDQISLDVGVGQIHVEGTDSDKIEIKVVIKTADEKEGFSFGFDRNDLDAIELVTKLKRGKMHLELSDQDDIHQHWILFVPNTLDVAIEAGVGEVSITQMSQDINVNVGVGTVEIKHPSNNFSKLDFKVGVGDMDLKHDSAYAEISSHLIGERFYQRGTAGPELAINAGVGEITIAN